jgi:hypothetical protein
MTFSEANARAPTVLGNKLDTSDPQYLFNHRNGAWISCISSDLKISDCVSVKPSRFC